jgi:DNA repair exonuclease SbcCD nuclease subunit
MAKIAIITDTHFGARDGRHIFHDFFEKFYTNTFFPTLKKYKVDTVLHLGDLFDRRKYIDYFSLKRSKEYFFEPMRDYKMHVLVGNHDIALRNSLDINSPELLLAEYNNILPISDPEVIDVHGVSFLMLPWICSDNYAKSMDFLKTAKADLCCGHLEISGFSMYKGMESHEGFDAGLFNRFDMVFSGHYHHRNSRSNIHYLGNPYQITHMDYNDPRGFHIFDTKTRELTFIENPYTLFERFVYDDTNYDPAGIDVSEFKEKFLKIVVQKKTDFYKFDTFLDRVYNCGAYDIKILEDVSDMTASDMDESIDIEDTQSILHHYIKSAEVDVDREKLSTYMKQLYVEAVNLKV